MKIEVNKTSTLVECTADELRQSNSLSDCLTNALRTLFIAPTSSVSDDAEEDSNDED